MNIPKKRNTGPSLDRALVSLGQGFADIERDRQLAFQLHDAIEELEQAKLDIQILLVQLDATLEAEETELEDEDAAIVSLIRAKWAMDIPTPKPLSKVASDRRAAAKCGTGEGDPVVRVPKSFHVYSFDRYRKGKRMAQGALVHAHDMREALAKASTLFPESPGDTFKLRSTGSKCLGIHEGGQLWCPECES